MTDPIRDGIQKVLDLYGDGWSISHYVVCMGLERIVDGAIQTCPWRYVPPEQPGYVTDALLDVDYESLVEYDGEP
jgi:hypothetical protein